LQTDSVEGQSMEGVEQLEADEVEEEKQGVAGVVKTEPSTDDSVGSVVLLHKPPELGPSAGLRALREEIDLVSE